MYAPIHLDRSMSFVYCSSCISSSISDSHIPLDLTRSGRLPNYEIFPRRTRNRCSLVQNSCEFENEVNISKQQESRSLQWFTSRGVDVNRLPRHISVIMDGNGRWALSRGLSRSQGHQEGLRTLKAFLESLRVLKVEQCTVFAFSTENWTRPEYEIESLMQLLQTFLSHDSVQFLVRNQIKLRVFGDLSAFNPIVQELARHAERMTERGTGSSTNWLQFNVAMNYGSRAELLNAVKQISQSVSEGKLRCEDISEELISKTLQISEPDLVIRTGGQKRLSNFMLWQNAYSELSFVDVLWPDFDAQHLAESIVDYQSRTRNFGGLTS